MNESLWFYSFKKISVVFIFWPGSGLDDIRLMKCKTAPFIVSYFVLSIIFTEKLLLVHQWTNLSNYCFPWSRNDLFEDVDKGYGHFCNKFLILTLTDVFSLIQQWIFSRMVDKLTEEKNTYVYSDTGDWFLAVTIIIIIISNNILYLVQYHSG